MSADSRIGVIDVLSVGSGHPRLFRGGQRTTLAFVTILSCVSIAASFVLEIFRLLAASFNAPWWQVWRLLTYALVEPRLGAFLLSTFVLLAVGPVVEGRLSRVQVVGL